VTGSELSLLFVSFVLKTVTSTSLPGILNLGSSRGHQILYRFLGARKIGGSCIYQLRAAFLRAMVPRGEFLVL
jgi:hypothetical protein